VKHPLRKSTGKYGKEQKTEVSKKQISFNAFTGMGVKEM